VVKARGVEVLTQSLNVVSHGGYWKCRLNALIASPVVVHVDEGLGLGARICIGCKFCWLVMIGKGRDVEHAVIEGLYFPFTEKAEAGCDSFVGVLRFLGLGRVEKQRVQE
jgi:hypothetical protein